MDDLHFSQLTHELDIAKHFALGHVFGVLLDDAKLKKKNVNYVFLKFVFSKKATKIEEIFTIDLTLTT